MDTLQPTTTDNTERKERIDSKRQEKRRDNDVKRNTDSTVSSGIEVKGNGLNQNNSLRLKTRRKHNTVDNYGASDTSLTRPGNDETDDLQLFTHLPFYKRLHNKFGFKLFMFCILFSLDAADLISDWLIYHDVGVTEEGLVYGPPGAALTQALLAFSIIGTFTFIFEATNLWFEVFRNNAWMDSELISAITLWIEDVPQIIINISIAACREEAISYFQLIKAAVIICSCVIRVIVSLIRYCGKRALRDLEYASKNVESLRHVIYRVVMMLGMLIILGGAITIFLFTQYERHSDGSINFRTPHSVINGEYDDTRYFQNVSVYFRHSLFDYSKQHLNEEDVNWIQMTNIYNITKETIDGTMKIEYDQETKSKFVIWQSDKSNQLHMEECFEINRTAEILQNVKVSSGCVGYINGTQASAIFFKFHFIKPKHPGLIFGDIKYNSMVKENGTCHRPMSDVSNINQQIKNSGSEAIAAMHYYRTKEGISEQHHVLHTPGSINGMFYQLANLTDISNVWKTGFAYCASTGSLAPHLDTSINVDCV